MKLILCAIELSQLLFRLGLLELDDVMNNTLGACAGHLAYSLLSMVFLRRRGRSVGT